MATKLNEKLIFFNAERIYIEIYIKHTILTRFMPLVSFYIPWKHQKTRGFPMFSGDRERDQWYKMG